MDNAVNMLTIKCKAFPSLLALMLFSAVAMAQNVYPAECRVGVSSLNVRSGPGTNYGQIGVKYQGDIVTIKRVVPGTTTEWGVLDMGSGEGYVSMKYMEYRKALPMPTAAKPHKKRGGFWFGLWRIIKWLLGAVAVILGIFLIRYIVELAIYAGIFAGIGALLFWIFGGNASTGAIIGLIVAALIGVRMLVERLDIDPGSLGDGSGLRWLFMAAYYLISFPFYMLNRLEHFLMSPWRYIFKYSWVSDSVKPALRVILEVLGVIICIAITPLRLFNAVVYNILIHCVTGIYDLLFEVMMPCDESEGCGNVWRWILMFPWRLLKYPIGHGLLAVVESVVWTVVDVFVPAITVYHGTDLTAGDAITRDPRRNKKLKSISTWNCGTFTASSSSWGGIGVYFASRRSVAMNYANDPYRLSDDNPVVIACRVSMGRIINYALAPKYVFNQAGSDGRHSVLNKYGKDHGYTTGEWWNPGGGYWEYCLFDWQNRYNDPWRIRPVYMLNLRTCRAQHVTGGMQHWLFDRAVINNIKYKLKK